MDAATINVVTLAGVVTLDTICVRAFAGLNGNKNEDGSSRWSGTLLGSFMLGVGVFALTWGGPRLAAWGSVWSGVRGRRVELVGQEFLSEDLLSYGALIVGIALSSVLLGACVKRASGAKTGARRGFLATLVMVAVQFVWVIGVGIAVLGPGLH